MPDPLLGYFGPKRFRPPLEDPIGAAPVDTPPDALAALLGMPRAKPTLSPDVQDAADRQTLTSDRSDDMARNLERAKGSDGRYGSGATPSMVQRAESDLEADPVTGTVATDRQKALDQSVTDAATFNRPDVAGVRQQQQQDALARVLAPIREQGVQTRLTDTQRGQITPREQAELDAKQEIARTGAQARTDVADTKAATAAPGGKVPPQAAQAAIVATQGLAGLPKLRADIQEMVSQLGPLAGRAGQFVVGKIGGGELGMTKEQENKFAHIQSDFLNLSTKMAASAGTRGMVNSILQRYTNQLAPDKDPSILNGVLDSWESALRETQKAGQPGYGQDAFGKTLEPQGRYQIEQVP